MHGLANAELFAAMKPGAIFITAAGVPPWWEQDLLHALDHGPCAAGLICHRRSHWVAPVHPPARTPLPHIGRH
jgi:gluconate 2-dehydrogenase